MDYNEVVKGFVNRHPWELSRTRSVHRIWEKYYLTIKDKTNKKIRYINIGAGDCYFDKRFVEELDYELTAVDIAYPEEKSTQKNIIKLNNLNNIEVPFSFGIMMDSLEYMDDDIEYIRNLASMIEEDGYIFLTLPAHQKLFSNHDVLVGNKRRYDKEDILRMEREIDGLHIERMQSFYWSLCLIRKIQKLFNLKANEKVTTGWKYPEKSLFTKIFTFLLDFDFYTSRIVKNSGLSWLVVFKVNKKQTSSK